MKTMNQYFAHECFRSIPIGEIPDWAVKRACEIVKCGFTVKQLRGWEHDDSYVYAVWSVAEYVSKTEQPPPDRLKLLIEEAIGETIGHVDTAGVSHWPGTYNISLAVIKAIRSANLTVDEIRGIDV